MKYLKRGGVYEICALAIIMVGSLLEWARGIKQLKDYPELESYVKHLTERPAFARLKSEG